MMRKARRISSHVVRAEEVVKASAPKPPTDQTRVRTSRTLEMLPPLLLHPPTHSLARRLQLVMVSREASSLARVATRRKVVTVAVATVVVEEATDVEELVAALPELLPLVTPSQLRNELQSWSEA